MMKHTCLFGGIAAAMVALPAIAQPANDGCNGAITVTGLGNFAFTTVGATSGNPAGSVCTNVSPGSLYHDVWFAWVANFTGPVRFGTCGGAAFDTKIAVYSANSCPPGAPIECADDSCGLQSELAFSAVAGQRYVLRIGAFAEGQTGAGTFTLAAGVVGGPFIHPTTGHRYFLLGPGPWTNAQAMAADLGGTLATIDDADENTWVRDTVVNSGGQTRMAWIGYNDAAEEGTWVWDSGDAPGYSNWQAGEPNNFNGVEHYALIDGASGMWQDRRNAPGALVVFAVVEVDAPLCTADFNGVDGVTVQDIYDFLAAVVAMDPRADINGMDGVTIQDVYDYLELWVAGCP